MSGELRQGTKTLKSKIESSDPGDLLNSVTHLWQLAVRLPCMPPSTVNNAGDLVEIRDFFEVALQAYIKLQDVTGIEQCFEILISLYQDYNTHIQDPEGQWKIIGLYLTFLLSYNKIEKFHCELEAVPWELFTTNKYISFAITLEQFFMEGNYNEVLLARPPSQEFSFFVGRILDTIRFEIAASFEKAYESLSLQSACKLLKLNTQTELTNFLSEFSTRFNRDVWKIEGNYLIVKSLEKRVQEIPKWQLIDQAVNYAIELERIV